MSERLAGVALFLPVPLVLWLFTRAPLGVPASLGLGAVVMLTHRLYARPWALRRSRRRCLWCGRALGTEVPVALDEPGGRSEWGACATGHRPSLARTLSTAGRWAPALRLGILGGLALFLPLALLGGLGLLGPVTFADAVAFFKLAVAATVLPFGWLAPRLRTDAREPIAVPFPVHIQALIGTWAVLWLFRIVGVVWLVQAIAHALRHAG